MTRLVRASTLLLAVAVGLAGCALRAPQRTAPMLALAVGDEHGRVFYVAAGTQPGSSSVGVRTIRGILPGSRLLGLALLPGGDEYLVTSYRPGEAGRLWKVRLGADDVLGSVQVGVTPDIVAVTPDGETAFVLNTGYSELAGEAFVSRIAVAEMRETGRTPVCQRARGGRFLPPGDLFVVACMMEDRLELLGAASGRVERIVEVRPGSGSPGGIHPRASRCGPTWVEADAAGRRLYVVCGTSDEVLEVDRLTGETLRRFEVGAGAYRVAISPDDRRLLVSLQTYANPATEVVDLVAGAPLAWVDHDVLLPHSAVFSRDGRHALVTVTGVQEGRIEVLDVRRARVVERIPMIGRIGFVVLLDRASPAGRD
jgi:DNA-binding beta-propeller fold protein YncE